MRSYKAPRRLARRLFLEERGETSWLTYLLLLGAVGGIYLLIAYAPVYLDHYNARSKCEETLSKTWRYKDEERTRLELKKALAEVRMEEAAEFGEVKKLPAIRPRDDELRVTIDESVVPPMLRIEAPYTRVVKFPFIKKQKYKSFTLECEIKLE
ncbi:MAG: hypothetical protein P1V51_19490 [Deltaproteobacteria bacterium]|nr:hypothetical protein [Deltaproteobacteria bacterium]